MIIMIEGPDGAGKTELAKKMSRQTGFPIVHFDYPKTTEDQLSMFKMYRDAITKKNVIFDRCWYSELVYGEIMRDVCAITVPQMYTLERDAAKFGALIIYCSASKTTLWTRCKGRGEDYIKDQNTFVRIYDAYEDLMRMPHYIPVTYYEYTEV